MSSRSQKRSPTCRSQFLPWSTQAFGWNQVLRQDQPPVNIFLVFGQMNEHSRFWTNAITRVLGLLNALCWLFSNNCEGTPLTNTSCRRTKPKWNISSNTDLSRRRQPWNKVRWGSIERVRTKHASWIEERIELSILKAKIYISPLPPQKNRYLKEPL